MLDVDSLNRKSLVHRIKSTVESLINRSETVSGYVVIVNGMQIREREPTIRLGRANLNRLYQHDLTIVNNFYSRFEVDQ